MSSINMERKIALSKLNRSIHCAICKGYLVEATTILECLHTFCRNCLVLHLKKNNYCPTCKIILHYSYPLEHIKADNTFQAIIDKLLPHLKRCDEEREMAFYGSVGKEVVRRKRSAASAVPVVAVVNAPKVNAGVATDRGCFPEQIALHLQSWSSRLPDIERRFLLCPSSATLTALRKLVAYRIFQDDSRYVDVELLLNNKSLGQKENPLRIALSSFYAKHQVESSNPIVIHYRHRADIT